VQTDYANVECEFFMEGKNAAKNEYLGGQNARIDTDTKGSLPRARISNRVGGARADVPPPFAGRQLSICALMALPAKSKPHAKANACASILLKMTIKDPPGAGHKAG
jgi:hypothetical protein